MATADTQLDAQPSVERLIKLEAGAVAAAAKAAFAPHQDMRKPLATTRSGRVVNVPAGKMDYMSPHTVVMSDAITAAQSSDDDNNHGSAAMDADDDSDNIKPGSADDEAEQQGNSGGFIRTSKSGDAAAVGNGSAAKLVRVSSSSRARVSSSGAQHHAHGHGHKAVRKRNRSAPSFQEVMRLGLLAPGQYDVLVGNQDSVKVNIQADGENHTCVI